MRVRIPSYQPLLAVTILPQIGMSEFDEQVCVAVLGFLREAGYQAWRYDLDKTQEDPYRIRLTGIGSVVVLPPYLALYDLKYHQVGRVELDDPQSFDKLVQAIEAEKLSRTVRDVCSQPSNPT